jgi:1,4-alpha-glucan branching enzyme
MKSLPEEIQAVIAGDSHDPFKVLGGHFIQKDGKRRVVVRVFHPWGREARLILPEEGRTIPMERTDEAGFFVCEFPDRKTLFPYRVRIEPWHGEPFEYDDPYRFLPVLSDYDQHLFREGNHFKLYEKLGAHPLDLGGVGGVHFAVWAPNARRVSVIGDFNAWDGRIHPMRCLGSSGVWEIFIPGMTEGTKYKFEVRARAGHLFIKSDPFARASEVRPRTASLVADPRHEWKDGEWMSSREKGHPLERPLSIYEVHLGSWRRVPEEGKRPLSYLETADQLVGYAKEMGFTHLEFLPLTEHPLDESWGYQCTGYYSATSRFGRPEELMALVDAAHLAGLGVLMDWVPGHFPTDGHGLADFDGTALYEHADPRQGYHPDWSTLIFNYGRTEVSNFLHANALYWLDTFHLDGLRVDAVASMLYLDYSRKAGEWIPNEHGGRENLEAIAFIKKLNALTHERFPGTMMVAEESTAWPMVSRPTYVGGLGFTYKWNMGWMHDTLLYFSKDPIHRKWHHNALTFSLLYAFTENFILPLSHDEVVHGKGSLIGRMPGDWWQQFANLRLLYGYLFTHPGKKLLFMGGEFGQFAEWNSGGSLDWHLLDYPTHRGVQAWVRDLNSLYRREPALWAVDTRHEGFQWIDFSDVENGVVAYLRRGGRSEDLMAVVLNMTPIVRHDYRLGVPEGGFWREMLNSDAEAYGGSNTGLGGGAWAEDRPWHDFGRSLNLLLPPLGCLILKPGR